MVTQTQIYPPVEGRETTPVAVPHAWRPSRLGDRIEGPLRGTTAGISREAVKRRRVIGNAEVGQVPQIIITNFSREAGMWRRLRSNGPPTRPLLGSGHDSTFHVGPFLRHSPIPLS